MEFISAINPLHSLSGFCVGTLVGMTGVGGGSLMTPLLILLFGFHPATAVGTDLLYASATKTAGTFMHGLGRTIDWRVVGRLASGSVPAAVITLIGLSRVDLHGSAAHQLITVVLGAALFCTAFILIFRRTLFAAYAARVGELDVRRTGMLTTIVGAGLGILVSISSVGAGAIGVTALIMLYPRLPIASIVGSDIAHAVPLTLIAGLGHWMLGSIDGMLLGSLLVGSLPGVVLGSHLATRVPEAFLRLLLAAMLLVAAGKLLF